MRKVSRLLSLATLVAMLLGVLGGVMAQSEPKILVTGRQMGPSDIPTLDPARSEDVPSTTAIDQLFVGLSRLNEETVEVEAGLADVSLAEDGVTYTFTLRAQVPWVRYNADSGQVEELKDDSGNTLYVTAGDFEYGMKRTLDPTLAAAYGYVLAAFVVGGSDYNNAAEATAEEQAALRDAVQITAVDDMTLQVVATEKAPFVATVFSLWITYAQPQIAIEAAGDAWTEPENIATYGPFALKEWNHDENLTIIRNPFWPGLDTVPQPKLDEVQFLFLDDAAQLAAYEAGNLDVSEVPISDIDRIRADATLSAELHAGEGSCTYYYGFNTLKAPMDDVRVRQAFSLSIDRDSIVNNVTRRGETPALMFTRPEMVAAPTAELFPDDAALPYNPDEARALLQAYLDEKGMTVDQLPTITLLHNTSALHATIAQAIQGMWRDVLGVEVQITAQDFGTFLQTRRDDPPQIFRAAWCYDYPDTNNFLFDVFHSSVDPDVNWNNAEFDGLVEQARALFDATERQALYAEAEGILVRDVAAIAPIYFYASLDLTKPGITRTYSRTLIERYEKWDITR
jgi:oligopeptide transport system substrate-binding protein